MTASKKHLFPVLALGALLALPLSGCGGGSAPATGSTGNEGGDAGSPPGDDDSGPDAPDGGGTDTSVDTTSLRALLDEADTLTATSFHCLAAAGAGCDGSPPATAVDSDAGDPEPDDDGTVSTPNDGTNGGGEFTDTTLSVACAGRTCVDGDGEGFSIDHIAAVLSGLNNASIGETGGVRLVEFAGSDGGDGTTRVWGGWLEHVFFGVMGDEGRPGSQEGPLSYLEVQGVVAGLAETTRPTAAAGSATWTGAMVGRSVDPAAGPVWDSVKGAATLRVDFGDGTVDVVFANITDAYGDAWSTPGMSWANLPMSPDGGTIEGRFFGSGHAEAAGVFDRDRLVGAFGASRDAD